MKTQIGIRKIRRCSVKCKKFALVANSIACGDARVFARQMVTSRHPSFARRAQAFSAAATRFSERANSLSLAPCCFLAICSTRPANRRASKSGSLEGAGAAAGLGGGGGGGGISTAGSGSAPDGPASSCARRASSSSLWACPRRVVCPSRPAVHVSPSACTSNHCARLQCTGARLAPVHGARGWGGSITCTARVVPQRAVQSDQSDRFSRIVHAGHFG